jgi:hypothetical protein
MKTLALVLLCVLGTVQVSLGQAKPPREIAGFRLGSGVDGYTSRLEQGEIGVALDEGHLRVVPVKKTDQFRSGFLSLGNCLRLGQVLRVKLNYTDESLAFFEKVLQGMKERFGEPTRWLGNPFGTLRIWRWSFTDPELGEVSLVLQHYTGKDDAFARGNSIRISATSLVNEELECQKSKRPSQNKIPLPPSVSGTDWYLPR